MGGCAIGDSPARGVVDHRGRHFQLENLTVSDGSVFPTSIGANPQLSIYGLAARNISLLAAELLGRPTPAIPDGTFNARCSPALLLLVELLIYGLATSRFLALPAEQAVLAAVCILLGMRAGIIATTYLAAIAHRSPRAADRSSPGDGDGCRGIPRFPPPVPADSAVRALVDGR